MTHRRGSTITRLSKALDAHTLYLDQWHTPATGYPTSKIGNYRIRRDKYTRGSYKYWGLDGYLVFRVNKAIPITTLQQRRGRQWYGWMVDDPPQQRAMEIYAAHAKGKVLVVGLGLGLYLHELAKNSEVEKVTVIEISKEVIQLVEPFLPSLPKFTVIHEDFYNYLNNYQDSTQWDTILVDLWVSHSVEDKLRILYHDICPLIPVLRYKYPRAGITFHGFQTVSDVKPVSNEMVKLITDLGGIY